MRQCSSRDRYASPQRRRLSLAHIREWAETVTAVVRAIKDVVWIIVMVVSGLVALIRGWWWS